jgi:hypothetical protein
MISLPSGRSGTAGRPRNGIERLFCRPKDLRLIISCFDKFNSMLMALLRFAFVVEALR